MPNGFFKTKEYWFLIKLRGLKFEKLNLRIRDFEHFYLKILSKIKYEWMMTSNWDFDIYFDLILVKNSNNFEQGG